MRDKLLRERLKVEAGLVAGAHPFIVTGYVVKRGEVAVAAGGAVREYPGYTQVFVSKGER